MNESENWNKQSSTPPPSYDDAMYWAPLSEAPKSSPPVTNIPIHTPHSHTRASQITDNLQSQYSSQWQYTPPRQHDMSGLHSCPAGAQSLRELNEILVYPSSGCTPVYKVKDHNKVTIMYVKQMSDADCCDCSCSCTTMYHLLSQQERCVAKALFSMESFNCCIYNQQNLEVTAYPDVPLGAVSVMSRSKCNIVNQSGDLLFSLRREKDCCQYFPFEIYSPHGGKLGMIDNTRGIKNRLTLTRELPVRHKILLLFFTVFLQREDDARRRNRH